MNPLLAFVLLGAVGYFASSVIKSGLDARRAPKVLLESIVSALDELRATQRWITKPNPSTFLIWPKGTIGGITYPGIFVSYLQPNLASSTIVVTTFAYRNKRWEKLESTTLFPADFLRQMSGVLGMPSSLRQDLLSKVAGPVPERPPHGARPPW
ncbi:hypothetical protein CI1B_20150 [Bradyrhizobium ivorense]|uniref:Uncharacterized protein n=1 Tax=Bradyrhizobium ivorense TaxID=2511166 RepID=A0A508T5A6_9BRAD|nr:hypothetical protein [Bradyrhizobium ivorense]VIO68228.1 hypothetical protein CI1B_20150 [Bradyrhizobium ivorense]